LEQAATSGPSRAASSPLRLMAAARAPSGPCRPAGWPRPA
jgi:hypothetical protein